MIKIQLRAWNAVKPCQKNILYRINGNQTVLFVEPHEKKRELVNLEYCLTEHQYGIYGYEYRGQNTVKEHCKSPDILACVVDEAKKIVCSTICDVKSNISAFSDDLFEDNAMLTAIKEVRDFIEQIHAGILHKNSFMLYYIDDGYKEYERIGIVTKCFEPEKFRAVASQIERLFRNQSTKVPSLVADKLKTNLAPYMSEINKLRDFADKTITISGKSHILNVFYLEQIDHSDYVATIKIVSEQKK